MSENNKLKRLYKVDINKNDKVYEVCDKFGKLAKDLYNFSNYKIRQVYLISKRIEDGFEVSEDMMKIYNEIIGEIEEFNDNTSTNKIKFEKKWGGIYIGGNGVKTPLNSWLKDTEQFKALPATTSQEILGQLSNAWKGYFENLDSYTKDKSRFKGRPKPPKYKDKNKGTTFIIDKMSTTIKEGKISFKKARKGLRSYDDFNCCGITIPLPDWDRYKAKDGNLTYIRVVPKNNKYTMEVIYDIDVVEPKENKGRTIAIDIGVGRLATVSNNIGEKPFCINGNPLKSINNFWNKEVAEYKSVLMKTNMLESSKRYLNMCDKRNNRIDTYIHQSASYIINWCKKYGIDTIVIGKNEGWKQNINIGKETQTFVQIPFARFIDKIVYRAEGLGIKIVLQEESYTSKSSFIDNDYIPTYGKNDKCTFSGKRVKRGLYKSKEGIEIHADLNGAYNILRKYDNNFKYSEECYLHPYIVEPNMSVD